MRRMNSKQRQNFARIIAVIVIVVMVLSVVAPFIAGFAGAG